MNLTPSTSSIMRGPRPPGSPAESPLLEPRWLSLESGRRLFYFRGGDPQGPPVLFVHGIGGWAEQWLPTLEAFQGHRWLIPDLPGFGRSEAPELATAENLRASLLAVLDAEQVGQVMVVGNSLGGGLALRLTLDHPTRVDRLVLATAAGVLRQLPMVFKLARLPLFGRFLLSNRSPIAWARWRAQFGNQALVTPQFMGEIARFSECFDCRPTYLGLLRSGINRLGMLEVVTGELHTVHQPVLLVWGDRDRVIPITHGRFAAEKLPNVRFETFEGSGHYPHWEQPERFNQAVREFLRTPVLRACA